MGRAERVFDLILVEWSEEEGCEALVALREAPVALREEVSQRPEDDVCLSVCVCVCLCVFVCVCV